ncbi:hypothetical protein FGRMN_7947 [Fusarium graminum]|nr:hypothetical protein FGRMN_7947 [Fusarium graminum]
MPSTSMGPSPKKRKPKAPNRPAKNWEPYKARIFKLHITQDLRLKKVKEVIEDEFGFTACQWVLDKNVKAAEMAAIVRKRQHRTLFESDKRELSFTVQGTEIEPQKINRWMDRNKIPENVLYAPSPAALFCRTVSDSGCLAPSPIYSVRSLGFAYGDAVSIASSPTVSSPAFFVPTIGPSQNSHFTGHNAAPSFRTLPNQLPPFHHPPANPLPQGQADCKSSVSRHRYRQDDEDRLREELSVAEMLFGAGHIQTLEIQAKLAEVLLNQGRYRSAGAMVRRVIEGYRNANENDSINMLEALELLGCVLRHQGSYRQAHKLFQRVFELKKAILGEDHPSTMGSMVWLLESHINQRQYQEAEELGDRLMKKRKEILGQQHPGTLFIACLLIRLYIGKEQWKEAEELGAQLKKTSEEILGEQYPETLAIAPSLVSIYSRLQRWKGAEELGLWALPMLIKVLGKKHPYTLLTTDWLSYVYESQGQYQKVEELRAS